MRVARKSPYQKCGRDSCARPSSTGPIVGRFSVCVSGSKHCKTLLLICGARQFFLRSKGFFPPVKLFLSSRSGRRGFFSVDRVFFPAEKASFSTRKIVFGGAPCVLAAKAVLHVDHRLLAAQEPSSVLQWNLRRPHLCFQEKSSFRDRTGEKETRTGEKNPDRGKKPHPPTAERIEGTAEGKQLS